MRRSILAIALSATVAWPVATAAADDVRLRGSVRLDAGASLVRLRDVADLGGPEAEALGDIVIAPAPTNGRPIRVSVRDVRSTLRDAGAHLGRINLSGNVVTVRPRRAGPSVLEPMAVVSVTNEAGRRADPPPVKEAPALAATDLQYEATLRGAVVRHLLRTLALPPEDLRVRFDGADAEALLLSAQDHRFEIDPRSAMESDQVRFDIRAWRDGLVVARHEIVLNPLARVRTATALYELRRDHEIAPGDLAFETTWVPLAQAHMLDDGEHIIGRVTTRIVRAGQRIGPGSVRKPTIVQRGDELTVRRRVGGVAIAVRAEAREDGVDDQVIEARRPGERSTFLVRIVGPHEAVIPNEPLLADSATRTSS